MIELKPTYDVIFDLFDFADLIDWFPYNTSFWEHVDWERIEIERDVINHHLITRCSIISNDSLDDLKNSLNKLIDYDEEYQRGIDKPKFKYFLDSSIDDLAFLKNVVMYFSGYFIDGSAEINPYFRVQDDINSNHEVINFQRFGEKLSLGFDEDPLRLPVLNALGLKENIEDQKHLINTFTELMKLRGQVKAQEPVVIQLEIDKKKIPIHDPQLISKVLGFSNRNEPDLSIQYLEDRLQTLSLSKKQLRSKWTNKLVFCLWQYLQKNTPFNSKPENVTSTQQRNIIGQLLIHFELLQHNPYRPYDDSLAKIVSARLNDNYPMLYPKRSKRSGK